MTADCQACLVGVPLIKTPAGKPDNPIGACVKCGSLTCGEHGNRAPKPAFVCIQCDAALQAGSVGWMAWQKARAAGSAPQAPGGSTTQGPRSTGQGDAIQADADRAAAALQRLLPEGWDAFVTNFEEWAEQVPEFFRLIVLIRDDLDNIVQRLGEAARHAKPSRDLPGVRSGRIDYISQREFAALWWRLDEDGRRLLAAALLLALVMNLPIWSLPPQLQSIAEIANISFRDDFPPRGELIPFEQSRYR